jgi:hypothetical protein
VDVDVRDHEAVLGGVFLLLFPVHHLDRASQSQSSRELDEGLVDDHARHEERGIRFHHHGEARCVYLDDVVGHGIPGQGMGELYLGARHEVQPRVPVFPLAVLLPGNVHGGQHDGPAKVFGADEFRHAGEDRAPVPGQVDLDRFGNALGFRRDPREAFQLDAESCRVELVEGPGVFKISVTDPGIDIPAQVPPAAARMVNDACLPQAHGERFGGDENGIGLHHHHRFAVVDHHALADEVLEALCGSFREREGYLGAAAWTGDHLEEKLLPGMRVGHVGEHLPVHEVLQVDGIDELMLVDDG